MVNLWRRQKDLAKKRATVDAEKNTGTVEGKNEPAKKKVSGNPGQRPL